MKELAIILNIVGASQGIFLGLMLLVRKENRFANNILSLIIIFLSMPMIVAYLLIRGYEGQFSLISLILFPTLFLHGPLIYFYTLSMTTGVNHFKLKHLLHCIPAILILIIQLFINNLHLKMHTLLNGEFLNGAIMPIFLFSVLLGLLYTIVSWHMLYFYNRSIKEYFSDIIKLKMLWLKILLGMFLLMFFSMNAFNWLDFFNIIHIKDMPDFQLFPASLSISSILLTAFFVLRQPDIFRYTHEMLQELEEPGNSKVKYEKSDIDDSKKEEYLNLLLNYMKEQKPYLKEDLTLKELAGMLSIPSYHHLSIIINERLGQNFYTFINTYRINDVMEKLSDPKNSGINVLNLAYDSGFNSKATFNSVFKNITGITPTEYRNKTSKIV
jgi:AraC-like DNA-binding protein